MKTYQQKGNESLLILNQKTSSKIPINKVILIKGNINYTTFYVDGGKDRVVARSIKFFESHLITHGFLRVHRAFMINPNYIKEYSLTQEIVTMKNGHLATISRRRKHAIQHFKDQGSI